MWKNINQEVNNRVLKQLDKDTLLQVLYKIQQRIETKPNWNKTEFTGLISETLKNFRKELYSSVAKRMKRFGKRKSLYKNDTHKDIISQIPISCKLEASIKHEKQD
jgi:hypothetical protein